MVEPVAAAAACQLAGGLPGAGGFAESTEAPEENEWPLARADAECLSAVKELYEQLGVTPAREVSFDIVYCRSSFICITAYCKAKRPVSKAKLRRINHASQPRFLSPQAQMIEDALLTVQKAICDAGHRGSLGFHLPAVLIAQEFREWAADFLSSLSSAEEAALRQVAVRAALIHALQDRVSDMRDFQIWHEAFIVVTSILHEIQAIWPVYGAQESIEGSLKQVETILQMVFYNLVMYDFYVLRASDCGSTFSPATFNGDALCDALREVHRSPSGKVMKLLLQDPVVQDCHAHGSPSSASGGGPGRRCTPFPVLDKDAARRELGLACGLARGFGEVSSSDPRTGLVPLDVAGFRGPHRVSAYKGAVDLWLRLHSCAAGVARCEKLIGTAHKMSSLGGDFLLAEYASKDMSARIFDVVAKALSTIQQCYEGLEDTLREGINAMLKQAENKWLFGKDQFGAWHGNYQRAQQYRLDLASCIAEAQKKIAAMKRQVANLNVQAIRKELTAKSKELDHYLGETCRAFGQEHENPLTRDGLPILDAKFAEPKLAWNDPKELAGPAPQPAQLEEIHKMMQLAQKGSTWDDGFCVPSPATTAPSEDELVGRRFRLRLTQSAQGERSQRQLKDPTTRRAKGLYLDVAEAVADDGFRSEDATLRLGHAHALAVASAEGGWWEVERGSAADSYRLKLVGPPDAAYLGFCLGALLESPGGGRGGSRSRDTTYVVCRQGGSRSVRSDWRIVSAPTGLSADAGAASDSPRSARSASSVESSATRQDAGSSREGPGSEKTYEIRLGGASQPRSMFMGGLLDMGRLRKRFMLGQALRGAPTRRNTNHDYAFVHEPRIEDAQSCKVPLWSFVPLKREQLARLPHS